jgi:C-terminal processing protease CtpA/Prc
LLTDGSEVTQRGVNNLFTSSTTANVHVVSGTTAAESKEGMKTTVNKIDVNVSRRENADEMKASSTRSNDAETKASNGIPKQVITTSVVKGEHGIGLDLAKTSIGGVVITKFKEMPDGSVNPASLCQPALKIGDRIVGINGKNCTSFSEVVKMLRSSSGEIRIDIERD